jgi:diadenosine tetraphosphate (Ap4A) HIT family hydrolase
MFGRYQPDLHAYERRVRTGPCFVCGVVSRDPDFPDHHVFYEDDATIAFLNRYPTQYGYTLVAPRAHREHVTGDFTLEEYLGLQRVIYQVAEAVREEVGADRVYLLSLGSNEGNSHVHWHVVPLPPGTPYEGQQFAAVMLERAGVLKISEEEKAALAARIGCRMGRSQETGSGN